MCLSVTHGDQRSYMVVHTVDVSVSRVVELSRLDSNTCFYGDMYLCLSQQHKLI